MVHVKVSLKENSYTITIGNRVWENLGATLKDFAKSVGIGEDAVIITNPIIKQKHGRELSAVLKKHDFSAKFFEVPSGETSKSALAAFDLIEKIAAYSVGRKIFVIAFGGGVVGDLSGFVAAVYKRGIPYIQIPTTLLAQIDSAIGGKVGIDLPSGKNLVGAFYQPLLVWSDIDTLSTLDDRQLRNGLAEAVKYGAICDKGLFDYIENNLKKIFAREPKVIQEIVYHCSRIKAKVVIADERDTRGIRAILNFGHTVGHAIEAANQFQDYHHGEAVALGMRVAAAMSRQLGLLSEEHQLRLGNVLSAIGLPEKIQHVGLPKIFHHMAFDKKFKGKKNKFVLLTTIGSVKIVEGIKDSVIEAAIRAHM